MPFEKSASFEILNLGKRKTTVQLLVGTSPYTWNDRSMHFHARWRTERLKTRPFRDWTFCDLKGKGVFVGDALSVDRLLSLLGSQQSTQHIDRLQQQAGQGTRQPQAL